MAIKVKTRNKVNTNNHLDIPKNRVSNKLKKSNDTNRVIKASKAQVKKNLKVKRESLSVEPADNVEKVSGKTNSKKPKIKKLEVTKYLDVKDSQKKLEKTKTSKTRSVHSRPDSVKAITKTSGKSPVNPIINEKSSAKVPDKAKDQKKVFRKETTSPILRKTSGTSKQNDRKVTRKKDNPVARGKLETKETARTVFQRKEPVKIEKKERKSKSGKAAGALTENTLTKTKESATTPVTVVENGAHPEVLSDYSVSNENSKNKRQTDRWSECGLIFYTSGMAYGITSNLKTICIGTESKLEEYFKNGDDTRFNLAQRDALGHIRQCRAMQFVQNQNPKMERSVTKTKPSHKRKLKQVSRR